MAALIVAPLLKVFLEEFCYVVEQVETCVASVIDAVVAVGVYGYLELLAGLCQCVCVAYHIAEVYVIVGCAVDEQQVAA